MKYFTLQEANNLLPQIKLIVDEIKEKREALYETIEKYEVQTENREDILETMYLKTLIKTTNEEINELIEIIENFGVLVKGLDPFLVDFPFEYEGESVLLCWKEGEEKISYWHRMHEGFKGRKPISELNIKNEKLIP